jgi:hypothetical protein
MQIPPAYTDVNQANLVSGGGHIVPSKHGLPSLRFKWLLHRKPGSQVEVWSGGRKVR